MKLEDIRVGTPVRLTQKPSGCLSRQFDLVAGDVYEVVGKMGCLVTTTTGVLDETTSYHPDHVEAVPPGTPLSPVKLGYIYK